MFIPDYPAFKIDDHLVISDLHLGITRAFYFSGFSLPSQLNKLIKSLNDLKKRTKTKNLVIAGDIKHTIPTISWQELKELPELLKKIKFKDIILVKGNHDGNIERIVNDIDNVSVKKSFTVGDYFISHGHRKITTKKENILIGHNHPAIRLKDKMGAHYVLQCWIKGKITLNSKKHNLIVMPAFNPLSGSSLVNNKEFIGPLAKKLTKSAEIHLLDGTFMGQLSDLVK